MFCMDAMYLNLQRAIAAILILGSLAVIIVGRDDFFPLSTYPMYSRVFKPGEFFEIYAIRGERSDGSEHRPDVSRFFYPFDPASYRQALLIDPNPELVKRKLETSIAWYNRRLIYHQVNEPPLEALRVYKRAFRWKELIGVQNTGAKDFPMTKENSFTVQEAFARE